MINSTQRKKLKKVFKHDYSSDVFTLLMKRNIRTKAGNLISNNYIRQVFNGIRQNQHIEMAIFDVYDTRKKQLEKEITRRKIILNKKTEAATPV